MYYSYSYVYIYIYTCLAYMYWRPDLFVVSVFYSCVYY